MTNRQKDCSFLRVRILGGEDLSFFVKDYFGLCGCVLFFTVLAVQFRSPARRIYMYKPEKGLPRKQAS